MNTPINAVPPVTQTTQETGSRLWQDVSDAVAAAERTSIPWVAAPLETPAIQSARPSFWTRVSAVLAAIRTSLSPNWGGVWDPEQTRSLFLYGYATSSPPRRRCCSDVPDQYNRYDDRSILRTLPYFTL